MPELPFIRSIRFVKLFLPEELDPVAPVPFSVLFAFSESSGSFSKVWPAAADLPFRPAE